MIAAYDPAGRVVWGLGPTPTAALSEAHRQLAEKSPRIRAAGLGRLAYARLGPGADPLVMDGAALFEVLDLTVGSALQLEIAL
jgi:hypothetical protein